MIYKKVLLKDVSDFDVGADSYIEIYLNDINNEVNIDPRLPMIVVPGGAYQFCSQREGEPIALRFAAEGFNCFVLHYTCYKKYPAPHNELAALVDYIKRNSLEFNIDKNFISMVGFSAGAHLVGSYSFVHKDFEKEYKLEKDYLKPSVILLGYPVTSMILETQSLTKQIITENNEELINKLSVPENVTKDFPPTFIYVTKPDACVPIEHSYLLEKALTKNSVKHELLVFENGIHGGSLFNHNVYNNDIDFDSYRENRTWVDKSVEFIYKVKNGN